MNKETSTRLHHGDIMSPETRSRVMGRIRGKNTGPEQAVARMLSELCITFETHIRSLPGTPDFVIPDASICIMVDGDFWHGWKFKDWRLKLSEKWDAKIAATIRRDARNRCQLRKTGWQVVRIWEHQVLKNPASCKRRIKKRYAQGLLQTGGPGKVWFEEFSLRSRKGES